MMVHIPVLLEETLGILSPKSEDRILDCTFGGGGHTKAILDSCDCYVCAIDRDPEAEERAKKVKELFKNRFDFVRGNFSEIAEIFSHCEKFNGVLFDFGVSSFQIDEANRGFSFSKDAPLDMRMSREGISAFDVVNSFSEDELGEIIWTYGDEPKSRKIASEIIKERKKGVIKTTFQLAELIHRAIGLSSKTKQFSKIDTATKTFQAIRIFVNDELREISEALETLTDILKNNARIAMISFHALEDRIVKSWAKSRKNCIFSINKQIIKPKFVEIAKNPRSRSAILRGFVYNKSGAENIGVRGQR